MLQVTHVASGREWRGGQRQTLLLACGLRTHGGIAVRAVTARHGELARRLHACGVTVDACRWTAGLDPGVLAHLAWTVGPGTILHAHDNHAHALADMAARIRGAQVIATRRVDLPVRHPARWRRARAVIALSHAIAARLATAGVTASRIHVIPPGVPEPGEASEWPPHVPTPAAGDLLLVCIAALAPEKGVDVLVDAMRDVHAAVPHARLIVAGDGGERERLASRCRALGIDEVVTFAGHVSHPEALLDHATLAVQPSRSEGFGSSVLDALVRGVAVVASHTGGLPDALAAGGGVLVPPGDPGALARVIIDLLHDAPRRRHLAAQGRIAATRFGVNRMVAATIDVYRSP